MEDKGYYSFYEDSVSAKAAYLTDNNGWVVMMLKALLHLSIFAFILQGIFYLVLKHKNSSAEADYADKNA